MALKKKLKLHLKKGALHQDMNVPQGKPIPPSDVEAKKAAAVRSGDSKEIKRTTFALNAKKWHHN